MRALCVARRCSKLNSDLLEDSIQKIIAYSQGKAIQKGGKEVQGKKRNFTETVELQISLKNYDPKKDKRFSGTYTLPSIPRPGMKLCVLANAKHAEAAESLGVDFKTVDDLKAFNKNKKLIKKMGAPAAAALTAPPRPAPALGGSMQSMHRLAATGAAHARPIALHRSRCRARPASLQPRSTTPSWPPTLSSSRFRACWGPASTAPASSPPWWARLRTCRRS